LTCARAWLAAIALCSLACGGGTSASNSPSPTSIASPTPSASSTATPLSFKLTPEPGVKATGTISLTAAARTTTLELMISGLQASSTHVSHIHLGSCQARGGIAFALNPVVADAQGVADTRSTLNLMYPPAGGTWYVVVHTGPDMQGPNANYLLCGNLFA
jgi:CHRD domain-containing protein